MATKTLIKITIKPKPQTQKKTGTGVTASLPSNYAITLTYGDMAENHQDNQQIGTLASEGFSKLDLETAKKRFEKQGLECELLDLKEAAFVGTEYAEDDAYLLIVKHGVTALTYLSGLTMEQSNILHNVDRKYWDRRRKAVLNKNLRHNLCFSDEAQEPDYENKKGTIYAFKSMPYMNEIRHKLPDFLGEKATLLQAEGNYYYDASKCGIGFHGDKERRIVVGIRLGTSIPLHYQWYKNSKRIGLRIERILDHGDIYIMSSKAVGFDCAKRKIATLRHAAGASKCLK